MHPMHAASWTDTKWERIVSVSSLQRRSLVQVMARACRDAASIAASLTTGLVTVPTRKAVVRDPPATTKVSASSAGRPDTRLVIALRDATTAVTAPAMARAAVVTASDQCRRVSDRHPRQHTAVVPAPVVTIAAMIKFFVKMMFKEEESILLTIWYHGEKKMLKVVIFVIIFSFFGREHKTV